MKLGLHAYSLMLAAGLREYRPVGRGLMTTERLLEMAEELELGAVQLGRQQIPADDMVALVNLGQFAKEKGLELHLSTNQLDGAHLVETIHAAHTLGAKSVIVGLCCLQGNVKERQRRLETLLAELDVAITRAERYKMPLVFENGRHTAAADLAAFVQATKSRFVGVCYDMGNALTVPEHPVEAAETLAPYCVCAHMKDLQVYRSADGAMLVNCPIGEGTVEVTEVLKALKAQKPELTVFLQTAAERIAVPALSDEFLQLYPRITARALAGLLRRGILVYDDKALRFPHERKTSETEVLAWEEGRLRRSLTAARTIMGIDTMTLALG